MPRRFLSGNAKGKGLEGKKEKNVLSLAHMASPDLRESERRTKKGRESKDLCSSSLRARKKRENNKERKGEEKGEPCGASIG